MENRYRIPRGTYDIVPSDTYKWQYVEALFRKVVTLYNYREIVTPIFERVELFERSVGDDTDIVEKEMYKFQDRKGRMLALRPEGTASVVRSFVENNLGSGDLPVKLFYLGPMFRYDRPQKGRYRQFYQFGVENIGSGEISIDAEVIALGYRFLKETGLSNFILQINSLGCDKCSADYDKALQEYYRKYLSRLCPDCKNRLQKNPRRLLDCKVENCREIGSKAPSILDYLDHECRSEFLQLQQLLKDMKIPFEINPRIVRGLDYYNKTAFEFINNNLGAQNALIGGGRYNGLVKELGGNDIPGIGFAGGFERLIISMAAEGLTLGTPAFPIIFIVALGELARNKSVILLNELRSAGIAADMKYDRTSLRSQMKAADKSGAPYSLIIGEDELQS
ncbi:MAG: histidine--tRNA ligase, partial [Candidatus Cloacimonetes bacterium]|nr:histidine--tRNA ligase [Candidatus Cloacimonadota bacterium]